MFSSKSLRLPYHVSSEQRVFELSWRQESYVCLRKLISYDLLRTTIYDDHPTSHSLVHWPLISVPPYWFLENILEQTLKATYFGR